MPTGSGLVARALRLLLTLCLTMIWCGTPGSGQFAWAKEAAPGATVPAQPPPTSQELDRLFGAIKAAQKQIPREGFDPQAVVEASGKDSIRLFEWVRDHTHWVPYHGALRGPIGLLMDRTGNSLDRSLLLAELLRRGGHTVRLARVVLPEAQARELLAKVRPAPLAVRPAQASADEQNAAIAQLAKAHQLDEGKLREAMETNAILAEALLKDSSARLAEQSEGLLKAFGPVPAFDEASASAAEIAAMADHWWVQRQEKSAWIDLDPLLPDGKPGESRMAPRETIPVRSADGTVKLDAKFCQEVEVRVVIERRQGGKLAEEVVLKQSLRPADLIGQRITLMHVPMQWPRKLDLAKEADPVARLKAELPKLTEWTPVLAVGTRVIKGQTIRTTGQTKPAPGPGPGGFPSGGGFGGVLGGGGEGGAKDKGEFTAQWIDYVIRVPGQPPRTIRREGFDLLGPIARANGEAASAKRWTDAPEIPALYLLDQTDLILQNGRLSPEFFSHHMLGAMLKQEAKFRGLAATPDAAVRERQLMQFAEQLFGVSPILLMVAISRFTLDTAPAVYVGSPNILCYRRGMNFGSKGQAVYEGVIDLAANEVAVLPRARADAFRIRLKQGVADTVAEGHPPAEIQPYGNVSRLFEACAARGVSAVLVRNADEAVLKDAGQPPVAVARMRDALAGGYALVMPKQPLGAGQDARTGWWRVNSRTGDTVGVMDTGYNSATVDNMLIVTEVDLPAAGITVTTKVVGAGVNVKLVSGLLGSYCGAWAGIACYSMYVYHREAEQHKAEVERLQNIIKANRQSYQGTQTSGHHDGSRAKKK